jgi:hypothetical protein
VDAAGIDIQQPPVHRSWRWPLLTAAGPPWARRTNLGPAVPFAGPPASTTC